MPEVMSIEVDEEFDPRPPAQPFGFKGPDGEWNWVFVGGVAAAVVLVLALIFVVANPFGSDKKQEAVPTWEPTDPLKDAQVLPNYSNSDKPVEDLQNALDSWALFYTTGDITDVEDTFDLAGKQYALLLNGDPENAIKSAAEIKAEVEPLAISPEPAKVELGLVANAGKKGDIFTLRASITWTQPGSDPSIYQWDIKMKQDPKTSNFLISTIATTDPAALGTLDFCGAGQILEGLDKQDLVVEKLNSLDEENAKKSLGKLIAIRLKVWQQVEAAFKTSSAPDSVPVIIDQYKQSKKFLEEAKTLENFIEADGELSQDESIDSAHTAAEKAVSTECSDLDITGRW